LFLGGNAGITFGIISGFVQKQELADATVGNFEIWMAGEANTCDRYDRYIKYLNFGWRPPAADNDSLFQHFQEAANVILQFESIEF